MTTDDRSSSQSAISRVFLFACTSYAPSIRLANSSRRSSTRARTRRRLARQSSAPSRPAGSRRPHELTAHLANSISHSPDASVESVLGVRVGDVRSARSPRQSDVCGMRATATRSTRSWFATLSDATGWIYSYSTQSSGSSNTHSACVAPDAPRVRRSCACFDAMSRLFGSKTHIRSSSFIRIADTPADGPNPQK